MKKIILIRHGETDFNLSKQYCGRSDAPLNQKGRKQIEETAKALKSYSIEKIYSSNLSRALETAIIIAAGSNTPIEELKDLAEIDFGAFEGLTYEQIMEKYPDVYRAWIDNPETTHPPQGESLDELAKRAQRAIDYILADDTKGMIAAVTHQGVIKVILCKILGYGLDKFWQVAYKNGEHRIIEL